MTQQTFTDNVVIDGSRDITQLTVEGHSTQTQALQTWQDSAQTPVAKVTGDGRLQVGDFEPAGTMATDDALIEAHRSDTSTKPKRGLHTLGRISGALSEAITWAVQELELLGSGGVSSLQTALRARLTHKNTGTSTTAELRAGDFETTNETGTTGARVGKATGARAAVRNLTGAFLEQAVGAEISLENAGTITDAYGLKITDMPSGVSGSRYALYSGTGTAHFGDDLEVPVLAATPAANPPANFAKLYTKLVSGEPRLYTKDASGVEREISGSATFPNQNANVVFAGPASGGPAAPAFRALVAADIPNLDAAKITSGVFNNARVNWAAPSAIGITTPNTGNFTSLKANLSPYHEITTSQGPVYGLVNRRGDGPQPQFSLHRARGTLASPAAIQAGDVIGGLGWEGHDGTNYNFVAQIVAVANQNFSSGAHGTRIEFANTDDNTTNVTGRVTIHANGMLEAKVGATVAGQLRHTGTTLGFYNNTPVSRQTYGTPTGTATRTTFATSTVTLPQLAQRVKAIIDDLRAVGLFA